MTKKEKQERLEQKYVLIKYLFDETELRPDQVIQVCKHISFGDDSEKLTLWKYYCHLEPSKFEKIVTTKTGK
jgi:hypothetical protein